MRCIPQITNMLEGLCSNSQRTIPVMQLRGAGSKILLVLLVVAVQVLQGSALDYAATAADTDMDTDVFDDVSTSTLSKSSPSSLRKQQQQQQQQQYEYQQIKRQRRIQKSPAPTFSPAASEQYIKFMSWVNRLRRNGSPLPPVPAPVTKPVKPPVTPPVTPPPKPSEPTYCTCKTCTKQIWNASADGISCGARIVWVKDNDPAVKGSLTAACTKVSTQFPTVCGPYCDPNKCPKTDPNTPTSAPTKFTGNTGLYCYPDLPKRKRYTNVWSKYILEVRENPTPCDPNGNLFTRQTISVNKANTELTLQFKQSSTDTKLWAASEVRVLLPSAQMPYMYGTYKFRVKSVVVTNSAGKVKSNSLPASLVLGFFTWDPTDDFSTRENFSHEVDIELSKWRNTGPSPDGLFLVQPSGPHAYRFFTGPNKTASPGGNNTYQFTWNPNSILWETSAAGGQKFNYTTANAIKQKKNDYVQCLPANVDVRFNLWNLLGTSTPMQMTDGDVVTAIIDQFIYTPSGIKGVTSGGTCSRDCQCITNYKCLQNKCTK